MDNNNGMVYRLVLNITIIFSIFIGLTFTSCSNKKIEKLTTGNEHNLKMLVFQDVEGKTPLINLYKDLNIPEKKVKLENLISKGIYLMNGEDTLKEGDILSKKVILNLNEEKHLLYYRFKVKETEYKLTIYNIFQSVDLLNKEHLIINKSSNCKVDNCILNTRLLSSGDVEMYIQDGNNNYYRDVIQTYGIDVFLDLTKVPVGEDYTLVIKGHNVFIEKPISIR